MKFSQLLSKEVECVYPKERIDSIMDILHKNGYVTVKYLIEALHYSNATINRDLKIMENLNLVSRSYGGVELIESRNIPVEFRYHKMKATKRRLTKCAADLIDDGDTIFIGGSTTCEGIGSFITDKKNITVITNNMTLVARLSEHGIHTICSGGYLTEFPNILGGDDAVKCAMKYKTDKMFFSTDMFSDSGNIGTHSTIYISLYEAAIRNTDKLFFLADHTKLNNPAKYIISDFSEVCGVITDCTFSDEVKRKYSDTAFYEIV